MQKVEQIVASKCTHLVTKTQKPSTRLVSMCSSWCVSLPLFMGRLMVWPSMASIEYTLIAILFHFGFIIPCSYRNLFLKWLCSFQFTPPFSPIQNHSPDVPQIRVLPFPASPSLRCIVSEHHSYGVQGKKTHTILLIWILCVNAHSAGYRTDTYHQEEDIF